MIAALLPAAMSLISSGVGAVQEGQQRKRMTEERGKWNADNEAMFNNDYYGDYTQRADVQNTIKQMREEQKRQGEIDNNTAVVTGATPEAQVAAKDSRNKAMSSVFSNIAAQGSAFKDRTKAHYLQRKTSLQGLEYDEMDKTAGSANNLLYNGVKSLAGTDWAGIMGSNSGGSGAVGKQVQSDYTPPPKIGLDPNAGRNFG